MKDIVYIIFDEAKKMVTAFQDISLDEPGSNCGTNLTLEVDITTKNKDLFVYRYIVDQKTKELILLTPDNLDSYVGKTVHMRSPMFCNSDKYCSKCFGEQFYLQGIENVGIIMKRVSTRILNLANKICHFIGKPIIGK